MNRLAAWLVVFSIATQRLAFAAAAEATPGGADVQADAGPRGTAVWPIFHQIVAMTFPKGFVLASEEVRPPAYLQESVLQGENIENWTQMISVTGLQGAARRAAVTPEVFTRSFESGYQKACPTTFSSTRLPTDAVAKFSGMVAYLACGSVGEAGHEHSEAMLLITLKGDQDYYSIQWAQRGPASSAPVEYDSKLWSDRLMQLLPIRVCRKVAGEAAPYPSCIASQPSKP